MKPLHLVGTSRANWTMCGIKITRKEALPYCLARYAPLRYERDITFCPACWAEFCVARATP